jgi:hypothetical protein
VNPFRRLFIRTGQLPAGLRAELMAEDPLFLEEGLPGSITFRNYRRPRYRVGVGKRAVTGTIVVTPRRFVVWTVPGEMIDIAAGHPLRAAITIAVEKPGQLCFRYRAEQFRPDRSGTVEVRLRTGQAAQVVALVNPAT